MAFITYKKIPIIETGQMMYYKCDPSRKPYRWKIWDHAESNSEGMEFINKKEAKYRYTIQIKWSIIF